MHKSYNKFTLASFFLKRYLNYSRFFMSNRFTFKFGSFIFLHLGGLQISLLRYERFRLFLKRFIRKPDKSGKRLWLTPKYIVNLSIRSRGARMGKGKGKKVRRYLRFYPGKPFIEVSNCRVGKLLRFLHYLNLRFFSNFILLSNCSASPVHIYQNRYLLFNLIYFFR